MRAEIGLGIQSDKSPGAYARIAEAAEAAGFDVLSVYADLLYQPPLVALLEMARATRRVRLGAACWNPYSLHPYEIAGQAAALDAVATGRTYLGLARGTWLGQIGIEQPHPVGHLRDAVAVVRALLSGDATGVTGEHFRLAPGTRLRYDLPARLPPVLLGTWGPRTAALAGEIADEVKVGGSANPAMVAVIRDRIAVGTARAGRSVDDVGVVVGAVTVVDTDPIVARTRARREVAMYLAVVAELDPTAHVPADLLRRVRERIAEGDDEGAGRLVPDDVLDLFAFSGDPDQVAAQAQRLIDAGAHRVEFGTPQGLTELGGLDLLGTAVLPQLVRGPTAAPGPRRAAGAPPPTAR